MYRSIRIMKIKGINIFIHWTFMLLIGIVIMINVERGVNISQIIWTTLFILSVFICITIHEIGHALIALRYGIKATNLILLPIGGVVSIEKFPENPKQELIISMAGPILNLIIAFCIWIIIHQQTNSFQISYNCSIYNENCYLLNLFYVNIGIGALNLIPAYPLDGGRILRSMLAFKMNYIRATIIAKNIGKIIAVSFIALGIIFINLILPIIGLYIIFSSNTEEIYLQIKHLVKGIKIKDIAIHEYHVLNANMTVNEASKLLIDIYSKYFILIIDKKPVSVISRLEIMIAIAENKYNNLLIEISNKEIKVIDGDLDVEVILEILAKNSEQIHPVIYNNYYAGGISLNMIIEYLLLHKKNEIQTKRIVSIAKLMK